MRWTTIGLSAGAEHFAPDPELKSRDWRKRIVSLWIPAILGLGLLTAFAYVGVRIAAGKPQVQPVSWPASPAPSKPDSPAPAKIQVLVDVPPAPEPQPVTKPNVIATNFTVVTPQPGERYLQVAAVSPHMVLTYVDNLRIVNLEAVIAPGPTPDLLRVLVGPFADRDSMDQAKAQLEASGRSPIIRSY
jgi:cell division septation protein DedD